VHFYLPPYAYLDPPSSLDLPPYAYLDPPSSLDLPPYAYLDPPSSLDLPPYLEAHYYLNSTQPQMCSKLSSLVSTLVSSCFLAVFD